MLIKLLFTITALISLTFADYDYALEDINPSSSFYEETIGTSFFSNQVTLHYFGHFS